MTFAQPLMLLGALAALLPLFIHLFDRRRPRQVPFGAISFVLKSQRRTASRLKLKRLLLYTLRTLFFLAVPLALAQPQLSSQAAVTTAKGLAATVVVIDASLSMRWHEGKTPLFDEARSEARAALKELSPEEPATVLGCTRNPSPAPPLSFDRARQLALVDDVKPGFELADLNRCLEAAARVLDESPLAARRIVVVSAFTQNELHLESPPPITLGPKQEKLKPQVVLRPVTHREELANRAIIDVKSEPAPQLGPSAWQFTFTIKNFSREAVKDLELQLRVNGVVTTKGFVDLAANGTSQKTLAQRFTVSGPVTVEGVLAADALPDDDVRAVVVTVPHESRALLVNGAPSSQKFRDEAFFVDAALTAPGSPVRSVVRDPEAAWREDLAQYDVVMLLNVEAPGPEVAARLKDFVARGGGLFVSMGDHVEPDAFNAALGDVLPRKLRVVKTAVEPSSPPDSARAARLQSVSTSHPVMAPFTGQAREGLLSTRFNRYVLFEGESAAGVEVLGTMDDGAPVYLSGRHGKGRVLAFASTVDRDWCDAPIRSGFLPLMQRVAAWLTGSLDEREEVHARVGEVLTLRPEAGVAPAQVRPVSGGEVPVRRRPDSLEVTVGPLTEPGRYLVLDSAGLSLDALTFAATLDPAASDTTLLRTEDVSAWFGDDVVKTAGASGPRERTPLWTWLILVAVLAFFFEGVVLRT